MFYGGVVYPVSLPPFIPPTPPLSLLPYGAYQDSPWAAFCFCRYVECGMTYVTALPALLPICGLVHWCVFTGVLCCAGCGQRCRRRRRRVSCPESWRRAASTSACCCCSAGRSAAVPSTCVLPVASEHHVPTCWPKILNCYSYY